MNWYAQLKVGFTDCAGVFGNRNQNMLSLVTRITPSFCVGHNLAKTQLKICRHLSFLEKLYKNKIQKENVILFDKTKHKQIYYFPYIRYHASLHRLNVLVPVLTAGFIPVILMTAEKGIECATLFGCIGLFHCVIIYFVLKLNRNLIGIISVNKGDKVEEVIISAIGENGRRIDRIHKPNELIICGYPTKLNEIFQFGSIKDAKSQEVYKIHVRKMQILDTKAFQSLIGDPREW